MLGPIAGARPGATRQARLRSLRAPLVALLIALVVITPLDLVAPSSVLGADGLTTTTSSTYTLDPAGQRVAVEVDMSITNTKSSTVDYQTCIGYYWDPYYGLIPYTYDCSTTTSYYVDSTEVYVEHGITNLRVTANKGTPKATLKTRGVAYDLYDIAFASTWKGQTRTLRVTYDLPSGAPRSDGTVRVNSAFADFCAVSQGWDAGSVTVHAPSGFDMNVTSGHGTLSKSTSGGISTWTTGDLADPASFWACFTGENAAGYPSSTVTTASGRDIQLEWWPVDTAWRDELQGEVDQALDSLESIVGQPLPGTGKFQIREVASLGAYAGFFDPKTNIARIGEDLGQKDVVAHELSHAWFNKDNFDGTWLSEGMASWAAAAVTHDTCLAPSLPKGQHPMLSSWTFVGPKSTADDVAAVGYEYDAACYVVSTLAGRMSPGGMKDVLAALLGHKLAYRSGSTVLDAPTGAVDWQGWLDAVDELGLVPAGARDLDFAQKLLLEYGVTSDSKGLEARSAARAKYHALIDAAKGWAIPAAILRPMAQWKFSDATAAIAAGAAARAAAEKTNTALPEVSALEGTVRDKFQAATSLADLQGAAKAASDQEQAAELLVAARAAEAAPRDPLVSIGLIGSDLATPLAAALAAVKSADLGTTTTQAGIVTSTLAAAHDQGLLRVVVTAVVVLLLVLATLFLRRRRARSRALALAAASASAEDLDRALALDAVSQEPAAELEPTLVRTTPGAAVHEGPSDGAAMG